MQQMQRKTNKMILPAVLFLCVTTLCASSLFPGCGLLPGGQPAESTGAQDTQYTDEELEKIREQSMNIL